MHCRIDAPFNTHGKHPTRNGLAIVRQPADSHDDDKAYIGVIPLTNDFRKRLSSVYVLYCLKIDDSSEEKLGKYCVVASYAHKMRFARR